MRHSVLVFCVLLVLCASASAFDGLRKGFVLGGGLGAGLSADYSLTISGVTGSEDGSGLGLNLLIGYAWDEQNMIVYEGNVVGWKSDLVDCQIAQGFNGASYYHYFGEVGRSAFFMGGVGFYVFNAEGYEDNDPGTAFIVGGGYEFARHVQVAGYYCSGKTSDPVFDYDHEHISVLVSAVAF